MKEAEDKLPTPAFIRISRSHIINTMYVVSFEGETIKTRDHTLKVGKVYKRYVEERLRGRV
jgi:DNA-binding LytR/AlgR family response regulator